MKLVKRLQSHSNSRQKAAFLRPLMAAGLIGSTLVLNGCASGGNSPLSDALNAFLPGDTTSTLQASDISFASLVIDTSDRQGLLVLGAMGGAATFWPTGNNGMISLYHGGLQATAGLPEDLLTTHYSPSADPEAMVSDTIDPKAEGATNYVPWQQSTPVEYRLERLWEESNGLTRALSANARLTCGAPTMVAFPLGEQRVESCVSQRQWDDGSQTQAILWRDAQTKRLWAVEEIPWPGGPRIQWEVARPWW